MCRCQHWISIFITYLMEVNLLLKKSIECYFTFYCNQFPLMSAVSLIIYVLFLLDKVLIIGLGDYLLFPEFLKSNKLILLSFKFENILVSENIINVNKTKQTNQNDQCVPGSVTSSKTNNYRRRKLKNYGF